MTHSSKANGTALKEALRTHTPDDAWADDLLELRETTEVLSDPNAFSRLEAGIAEIERGETVDDIDGTAEDRR